MSPSLGGPVQGRAVILNGLPFLCAFASWREILFRLPFASSRADISCLSPAKLGHCLRRVDCVKNRGAGLENVRARLSSGLCRRLIDSSIDLNVKFEISLLSQLTSLSDLCHRFRHERLVSNS